MILSSCRDLPETNRRKSLSEPALPSSGDLSRRLQPPLDARTPGRSPGTAAGLLAGALLFSSLPLLAGGPWTFTDVTLAAGFNYRHGFDGGLSEEPRMLAGGVAAGDYDNDGWADL